MELSPAGRIEIPPGGLDALLNEIRVHGWPVLVRAVEAIPSPLFTPPQPPIPPIGGERSDAWEPLAVNLGHLAELCGTETSSHLERVQGYVRIIVADLRRRGVFREIDEAWEARVVRASTLHDIGKIAIPSGILLKPGPLSPSEREIMKLHVALGAESLEAMHHAYPGTEFWTTARDIAATHHERCDGSGYPRGLVGEAIPLCGRIVALVDVYDALTSRRVYKSAMAHESARGLLVAQSGQQFDPRIVEAFLRNQDQFRAIVNHFRD